VSAKVFMFEPETVPAKTICMWARNPVTDKTSQVSAATAGRASGRMYCKPVPSGTIRHNQAAIRRQVDNNQTTSRQRSNDN
jgi:hypothetical protein